MTMLIAAPTYLIITLSDGEPEKGRLAAAVVADHPGPAVTQVKREIAEDVDWVLVRE